MNNQRFRNDLISARFALFANFAVKSFGIRGIGQIRNRKAHKANKKARIFGP
jgi:hypothetical protein